MPDFLFGSLPEGEFFNPPPFVTAPDVVKTPELIEPPETVEVSDDFDSFDDGEEIQMDYTPDFNADLDW